MFSGTSMFPTPTQSILLLTKTLVALLRPTKSCGHELHNFNSLNLKLKFYILILSFGIQDAMNND